MKQLIRIVFLFPVIYFSFFWRVPQSRAQYFENPKLTFKKFEFEQNIRGGFNLSMCLIELLTCLETVKPDVICKAWARFESVCTPMFDGCDEDTGYVNDLDWYNKPLFENVCTKPKHQQFT